MNLSIGIVGLPNAGKSTLFNALLKKQTALVANYPFATIEPNIGIVPVPDVRLDQLAEITKEEHKMSSLPPKVNATVKFVDIAGLVKGAAQGEGLGNKFLSHIREVDAICHVVRYFNDPDIIHVAGAPDPESDKTVIHTELILADLQTLDKQPILKKMAPSSAKATAGKEKEDILKHDAIQKLKKELNDGKLAKDVSLSEEELELMKPLQLLTMKPMFFVANVSEDQLQNDFGNDTIPVCAKIEEELSSLSDEEQKEYLSSLGLEKSGLERIIAKGYQMLNLMSFLTAGEKEVRAWTIKRDSTAVEAAGTIHTDFMKKFIKAEVVAFEYFVNPSGLASPKPSDGGWKGSREKGRARFEGKEYVMKDGEVVEFKIGS
ncbi:MAG TPA: redox-regulated ATPase YchF [Candidatus Saccharimonadales bacterium]|nr:redox-regulated ATPase YchF [Candidatus Saccharimonadales bacterium]